MLEDDVGQLLALVGAKVKFLGSVLCVQSAEGVHELVHGDLAIELALLRAASGTIHGEGSLGAWNPRLLDLGAAKEWRRGRRGLGGPSALRRLRGNGGQANDREQERGRDEEAYGVGCRDQSVAHRDAP